MARNGKRCHFWDSRSMAHFTWNINTMLRGNNHCRNARDKLPGKDQPADYRDNMWCFTDETKNEWEYCDPKPATECPIGGVLISQRAGFYGIIKFRAFCV